MKFSILPSGYAGIKICRVCFNLLGYICIACTIMACHPKQDDSKLYILYLNNTPDKPELKNLLGSKTKKVTFQFFHGADNVFNLYAWPRDANGDYNKSKTIRK